MAAPKGNKFSPGRPKGSIDKVRLEFKQALNELLEMAAPQMVGWLSRIAENDPYKAMDMTAKLAEYVHPKLQRTTHEGDAEKPIRVMHTSDDAAILKRYMESKQNA